MEKFNSPKLPTMLEGSVMCVDSKAWNTLISYVNSQTDIINSIVERVDRLVESDNLHGDSIQKLAKSLKELLE